MAQKTGYCEIPMCRNKAEVIYLGRGVCEKHWKMHCEGGLCLKEEFENR